jgi:eukaryotic-like serine/threonine-protein kinase
MRKRWITILTAAALAAGGVACGTGEGSPLVNEGGTLETPTDDGTTEEPTDEPTEEDTGDGGDGDNSGSGSDGGDHGGNSGPG